MIKINFTFKRYGIFLSEIALSYCLNNKFPQMNNASEWRFLLFYCLSDSCVFADSCKIIKVGENIWAIVIVICRCY